MTAKKIGRGLLTALGLVLAAFFYLSDPDTDRQFL